MAGLKSPTKKKRDSSKPNTVLIIFLVFFILLSIGLGVWGYYGYAGQEKLEQASKADKLSAKVKQDLADYAMYLANEAKLAIGPAGNPKDPILTADEYVFFDKVRQDALKDGGLYKAEKTLEGHKKLVDAIKSDIGPYDETTKRYPMTYRELVGKLQGDLKTANTQLATTQGELKAANDKFLTLQTKQENYWKNALNDIKKGNADALAMAGKLTKEMELSFTANKQLTTDVEEAKKQAAEAEETFKRQIRKLNDALSKAAGDKTEEVGGPVAEPKTGGAEKMHALMLDISRGKPLWDNPLGKITRVDLQERHVYINIGSAHGIKPEVTFNIFAAGWNGRADKELRGTIEVIRVLDANSSLARITSLYDSDGREISLSDAARGSQNALKEGDLLFNMFWGARVALAGNLPFAGQNSDSPAEQMRIMASFVNFLSRQGISVDAYLDLNDGQVKGAISSRTRYLIRGDDLVDPASIAPAKKKDANGAAEGEEKKEAADPMPMEGLPDRLKAINDAAARMRREAADKGLLVISLDNFLSVVGYREPRSAFTKATGFTPSVIFAGQPIQNPNVQAAPKAAEEPAPPPAENKDAEKKDAEKKDAEKKDQ